MTERAIQVGIAAPVDVAPAAAELGTRLAQAVPGRWTEVVGDGWVRYVLETGGTDETATDLIARVLADYILEVRIAAWMERRLARRYPEWQLQAAAVRAKAWAHLQRAPIWPERGHYVFDRCRQALWWGPDLTVVDGIETFLLDRLRLAVEESVDEAVEDVETEREYRDFLAFLKGFVGLAGDGPEVVHVLPAQPAAGELPWLKLHDRRGRPVVVAPICGDDGRVEADALLSALLAVSPRRICLHLGADGGAAQPLSQWTDLVQEVFGPRVVQCPGCGECGGGRN